MLLSAHGGERDSSINIHRLSCQCIKELSMIKLSIHVRRPIIIMFYSAPQGFTSVEKLMGECEIRAWASLAFPPRSC